MNLVKWTEIENSYRNEHISKAVSFYPELLNEQYVVTEKVDGCLQGDSRIRMADMSWKYVRNIEVGDCVLGMDNGIVVESEVTHVFRNGTQKNWLLIEGTRENSGRGGNKFSINCTPLHKFWSPEKKKYVLAEELRVGDIVLSVRQDTEITPIQEQVILGKLLGDGHLRVTKESAALNWGHSEKQEDYFDWTNNALSGISLNNKDEYISGFGSVMYRGSTCFSRLIKDMFGSFIVKNEKVVPDWVSDKISPLSIAVWYMDDGSIDQSDGQEDRVTFSTNAFSFESCTILLKALMNMGIDASIRNYGKGNIIRLNARNAERLFLLICPYIPASMQYKLPERYRGAPGFLPVMSPKYKTNLVEQRITNITSISRPYGWQKYDIETTTHNYFAHDILVHNSNFQWAFSPDGTVRCASRNNYLDMNGSFQGANIQSLYESHNYLLSELLSDAMYSGKEIRLYGELFGQGIQKRVDYGSEKRLVYFGLMIDNEWQSFADLEYMLENYGCHDLIVPILQLTDELQEALSFDTEFDSLLNDKEDNLTEGVVIQPYAKVYLDGNGSPFILKKKNEKFGEKKKTEKILDMEVLTLNAEFKSYITENRLLSVFSKEGKIQSPKEIGKYIKLLLTDAQDDFLKDNDVSHMEKQQQKDIFNVGPLVANMLKSYL